MKAFFLMVYFEPRIISLILKEREDFDEEEKEYLDNSLLLFEMIASKLSKKAFFKL